WAALCGAGTGLSDATSAGLRPIRTTTATTAAIAAAAIPNFARRAAMAPSRLPPWATLAGCQIKRNLCWPIALDKRVRDRIAIPLQHGAFAQCLTTQAVT